MLCVLPHRQKKKLKTKTKKCFACSLIWSQKGRRGFACWGCGPENAQSPEGPTTSPPRTPARRPHKSGATVFSSFPYRGARRVPPHPVWFTASPAAPDSGAGLSSLRPPAILPASRASPNRSARLPQGPGGRQLGDCGEPSVVPAAGKARGVRVNGGRGQLLRKP